MLLPSIVTLYLGQKWERAGEQIVFVFLSCHQTALEIGLRQSWRVKPDFKTRIIYFQELNSDASPKKAVCKIVLPTQTGGLKRHEQMTVRHSAL